MNPYRNSNTYMAGGMARHYPGRVCVARGHAGGHRAPATGGESSCTGQPATPTPLHPRRDMKRTGGIGHKYLAGGFAYLLGVLVFYLSTCDMSHVFYS